MGTATRDYVKQQGLSLRQLAAVDLLVGGATDTETASKIGAHRVTITKWRLYDPAFQAELARRRQELWAAAADRLRALVPRALGALERELDRKPSASVREAGERGRVAFAVNLNRGGERWERRGEVRTRIGSSDSVRGWTSGGAGRGGGGVFRQGYGPGRSSWPGNTGWDGFHGGCGWTTMA